MRCVPAICGVPSQSLPPIVRFPTAGSETYAPKLVSWLAGVPAVCSVVIVLSSCVGGLWWWLGENRAAGSR
jgi:hypothetical protein